MISTKYQLKKITCDYVVKCKPKTKTDEEIKQYHRKRLEQLSLKSLGEIPQLDDPTLEQKEWVLFRLSHNNTWPKVHENRIGDVKNWK